MVSYTFDLALVKYYKESLDEYATFTPFKIQNSKDQTFYAKISMVNQGNLIWTFDNGGTEKTYTINANSTLELNEKLIASITPSETQKDQMQFKVEYFKDSALAQKFGEDTITAPIHIFIQNSDYSWTSTAYPNESDIVFDKWTGVNIPSSINNGTTMLGDLGNATVVFWKGAGAPSVIAVSGDVEDDGLRFAGYNFSYAFANADLTQLNKFISMVGKVDDSYKCHGYVGFDSRYNTTSVLYSLYDYYNNAVGTIKKFTLIPVSPYYPKVRHAGGTDKRLAIVWSGVYAFNKLP